MYVIWAKIKAPFEQCYFPWHFNCIFSFFPSILMKIFETSVCGWKLSDKIMKSIFDNKDDDDSTFVVQLLALCRELQYLHSDKNIFECVVQIKIMASFQQHDLTWHFNFTFSLFPLNLIKIFETSNHGSYKCQIVLWFLLKGGELKDNVIWTIMP